LVSSEKEEIENDDDDEILIDEGVAQLYNDEE
jgi:hypothetical protein